ncbi:hypothetical protein NG726_02485 [Pseudomonas sp. MOB-449]|nr:hypothetical protein [Pseudomonas sp. MOB-449]
MFNDSLSGKAEREFREAFYRLRDRKPKLLPVDTPISQNNVAKEAGKDPSALRKSRYPELIREIQDWVAVNSTKNHEKEIISSLRDTVAGLKSRIRQLTEDRDLAQSLLVQAHDRIVVLSKQNEEMASKLPSSNVLGFSAMMGMKGKNLE